MVVVARRLLVALMATMFAVVFVVPQQAVAAELPEITAGSAIVVDAASGQILYDKNATTPLPPASLTKLFTAFAALEVATLDERMTVTPADLVGEASMGLSAGEVLPFEALLYGMLLPSGNDAASTIARNLSGQAATVPAPTTDAFMAYLNGRASQIGLKHTRLQNPHGLDQDGHVSSARDIAAMTIYAMAKQPAFSQAIASTNYRAYGHQLVQTNELHTSYPGLIGGKTGVTENAGFCLMEVAERDGRRVVVVLLGSTPSDWYTDARTLLDYGFSALAAAGSPVFGQITFEPDAVTAPISAEALASLSVAYPSVTSAVVISEGPTAGGATPGWLWILSALIAIPCLRVFGIQTQSLIRLMRARPARPRSVPVPVEPVAWNTQPFVPYQASTPTYYDAFSLSRTGTQSNSESLRPAIAPSFGD